ncbi:MAG: hypothetical protein II864_09070 [Prevotella sp.]|nr:hypothetical protein [Prevotella sp.]
MEKIIKLCIKVLEYTKEHNMKISEEDFKKICGKYTDAVLAELHSKKVGTYVSGYKSIWSIRQDNIELALTNYKSMVKENNGSLWKWIVGLIISAAGVISAILC